MDNSPFQGNLGGEYPYTIRMTKSEQRSEYMRAYYKAHREKWARPPRQLELKLPYPPTQEKLERKRQVNRDVMQRAYDANPERYKARAKEWRDKYPERYAAMQKKKRAKRLPLFRAYYQNRLDTDPNFKMAATLRGRLKKVLKRGTKTGSAIDLLGCSIEDFWFHLESKFETGMTRENHGSVWHLDHIIPCAVFDLTKPEHQRRCFHFSNLQPLFAVDNLRKGAKHEVKV